MRIVIFLRPPTALMAEVRFETETSQFTYSYFSHHASSVLSRTNINAFFRIVNVFTFMKWTRRSNLQLSLE